MLIALPFVEGILLWMLNPGYFSKLLTSSIGLAASGISLLLIAIGAVWLQRIVRIEV